MKKFKAFYEKLTRAETALLTEGFKNSDVGKVASIIKGQLAKATGMAVTSFPETHFYENGDGVGKGLLYFIGKGVDGVRFNMSDTNYITSVDVWKNPAIKPNPTPTNRIETDGKFTLEALNEVLPIIKDIMEGKKVSSVAGSDEEVMSDADLIDLIDVMADEFNRNPEQLAASVQPKRGKRGNKVISEEVSTKDGTTYPDMETAIIELLQQGHRKSEIARMLGTSPSTVTHHSKKINVVAGKDEEYVEATPGEVKDSNKWLADINDEDYLEAMEEAGGDPWNLTITQKKDEYRKNVDAFIDPKQSGKAKSLIVCGSPGTGKSYDIEVVLQKYGMKENKDFSYNKGGAADTASKLYKELYNNRHGKIIIFDDADATVQNPDTRLILMAATDTTANVVQSSNANVVFNKQQVLKDMSMIKKAVARVKTSNARAAGDDDDDMTAGGFDELSFIIQKFNFLEKHAYSDKWSFDLQWLETYDEILMNLKSMAAQSPILKTQDATIKKALTTVTRIKNEERFPSKFEFDSKVITITNMIKEKIDGALLSRAIVQEIIVDQDDMIELIDTVLPYIRKDDVPLKVKEIIYRQLKLKESRNPAILNGTRFDQPDRSGRLPNVPINPRRIYLAIDVYLEDPSAGWKDRIFLHK